MQLCTWQTRHFTLNISIGETCLHEAYCEVCGLARFFEYVLAFLQHCVVPGLWESVLRARGFRNRGLRLMSCALVCFSFCYAMSAFTRQNSMQAQGATQ
eukprot:6486705-Amphidinium_carterae.1